MSGLLDWQQRFLDLAVEHGVLRFGDFTLKSGRRSPYFFNLGEVSSGPGLAALGECYAQAVLHFDLQPDCLFGPAYKGIPIAVSTGVALAHHGVACEVAFNRKEAKDHGEGGEMVGGALVGRVLVVDDVMSSGAAVRDAMQRLMRAGAQPAAILVAMDRKERGRGEHSAVQEVEHEYGLPVRSIVDLDHVVTWLEGAGDAGVLERVRDYRATYGVR